MNERTSNYLIWGIAICCVILAISHVPNKHSLNSTNQEIHQVNNQLAHTNTQSLGETTINGTFNVTNSENKAQKKLHDALATALGGIHSNNDWSQQKSKLQDALGSSLTKKLKAVNQDPNSRNWIIKNNNGVDITFGQVKDPEEVPVTAIAYTDQSVGKVKYVITMDYNLKHQSVMNYQLKVLSNTLNERVGNNSDD